MTERFEIIKYTPALKETVLELQTNLWSSDLALNAAYLEWKYENNPYSKEPLIYLAMNQGRAVGMRGVWATKWQIGSAHTTFLIPYADELVIDPNSRNQGLIAKMMKVVLNDLAKRGFDYVLNLSAGAVTTMSSLAAGWKSAGSMEPMILTGETPFVLKLRQKLKLKLRQKLKGARLLSRLANSSLIPNSKLESEPFINLDRNWSLDKNLCHGFTVERMPQPEAMAHLINRLGYDGRLRHIRDVEYLHWRYQNPLHTYRFVFSWKGKRLQGYLALQSYVSDLSNRATVNLVDWEAADPQTKALLLRAVVQHGQFPELFTWGGTLPREAKQILKEAGFVPIPQIGQQRYQNCLLLRRTLDGVPASDWVLAERNLLEKEDWDIRLIYSARG